MCVEFQDLIMCASRAHQYTYLFHLFTENEELKLSRYVTHYIFICVSHIENKVTPLFESLKKTDIYRDSTVGKIFIIVSDVDCDNMVLAQSVLLWDTLVNVVRVNVVMVTAIWQLSFPALTQVDIRAFRQTIKSSRSQHEAHTNYMERRVSVTLLISGKTGPTNNCQ